MSHIRNLLAQALESEAIATVAPDEKTIVMKGPLAEVFTRALDIAYAKPDPITGEAMESQQMDVAMMQKLAAALNTNDAPPTNNFQTVYGVSRDAVTPQTIVDLTQEITHGSDDRGDFYLIIDGTQPGDNGNASSTPVDTVRMISAMECLVEAHGGKVFTSLEEFAKSR